MINKLSTDVTLADLEPHGPADVLLSEILGTLMLGESALEYNADARDRGLVKPTGALVPSAGKQFVSLVESADIELITVRARPGRLSALSVSHSKSILYGAFVWACRALNSSKRRFPARAVRPRLGRP